MNYPKPLMSISELAEMGFSKDYLRTVVHAEGQRFATLTEGGGKWQIDTEEFEKFRKRRRETVGRRV